MLVLVLYILEDIGIESGKEPSDQIASYVELSISLIKVIVLHDIDETFSGTKPPQS